MEWFLQGKIPFPAIADVVRETLSATAPSAPRTIGEVLEADRNARLMARKFAEASAARAVSV